MERDAAVRLVLLVAGGPLAVGRRLGISGASVSNWARIPAERVLAVAKFTDLPPHVLRPDLYPVPAAPGRERARAARRAAAKGG